MPGQLITLPGVTSGAPSSAERIVMSKADKAASAIPVLAHVMAAKSTKNLAGGLQANCRNTGAALESKGGELGPIRGVYDGFPGVGLGGNKTAGLAFPPGSFNASFCIIATIFISDTDFASGGPINFLSGFEGDSYTALISRFYPADYSPPNVFRTNGPGVGGNLDSPAQQGWQVYCVDYNAATQQLRQSVNNPSSFQSRARSPEAIGNDAYVEIGYHLGPSSLRDSAVGDVYIFNESVVGNAIYNPSVIEIIEGLMEDYGIEV